MSMREPIVLCGRIVGNNRDVGCLVSAIKVHHSVPGIFAYASVKIASVDQEVPNGLYELRYANASVRVIKSPEGWRASQ
jgi:hypothetical protein